LSPRLVKCLAKQGGGKPNVPALASLVLKKLRRKSGDPDSYFRTKKEGFKGTWVTG